jgi:2-isopropylmalate synthase
MERLELLDSTLRDGAQGEGVSFSVSDKQRIALALGSLGVDLIEAGNPGSNPKDLEFFRRAEELGETAGRLCAFGPTRRKDLSASVDPGLATLLAAGTATLVVFGKSWDLHVREVLKASADENLAMIADTVGALRAEGRRVIYDAEHFFDGWAADPEYALETLRAAAEAGAARLVLCDTNGGSLPWRVQEIVQRVAAAMPVPIGIHAHDDAGLAVANSLTAVQAGATHVQGTLVGFGERCGNANLAVCAAGAALKLGKRCLGEGALARIGKVARLVADIANVGFDEGMPYLGRRAFAHKAGMHVDAVAKAPRTFEHVAPESVGNARRFLASEVGGRAALLERIRVVDPEAGKDSPLATEVLSRLKALEAQGYQFEAAEASLELLVRRAAGGHRERFRLLDYQVFGERPGADKARRSRAFVKIEVGGLEELAASEGDGPVNALDLGLRKALGRFYPSLQDMRLTDYKVRVLDGTDATAAAVRVLVESADGSGSWSTVGVSTDIIEASWIALVDSIEYKLTREKQEWQ